MELVPVIRVPKEQGIPLPHNDFTFNLPANQAADIVTTTCTYNSKQIEDVFAIALSEKGSGPHLEDSLELILDIEEIGVLCRKNQLLHTEEGIVISCDVLARLDLDSFEIRDHILWVGATPFREELSENEKSQIVNTRRLVQSLIVSNEVLKKKELTRLIQAEDMLEVADILCSNLPMDDDDRLHFLQCGDNIERIELATQALTRFISASEREDGTKKQVARSSQKQKQKPKTLAEWFEQSSIPETSRPKIQRELARLDKLRQDSAEHGALDHYLRTVLRVPWGKVSRKDIILKDFVNTLNETHYGLDDVKHHLLEYMAIEQLTKGSSGMVLCFTGEPGTGKTSLCKQIAKAAGRKLVRVALGGVGDEAELRGHRRTYVAAKPGRLVDELIRVQRVDPLIMFDEVDKTDKHHRGVVNSLLEVLDPEQNDKFRDRYLEIPVDLSKAMFICTANDLGGIPSALRDRLEIINFRKYEKEERLVIATQYVIPRWLKEYSMDDLEISFADETIDKISDTKSIRDIERLVRKMLRMSAVKIMVDGINSVVIDADMLKKAKGKDSKKKSIGFAR
jgi:ATP-dependent Lon protease